MSEVESMLDQPIYPGSAFLTRAFVTLDQVRALVESTLQTLILPEHHERFLLNCLAVKPLQDLSVFINPVHAIGFFTIAGRVRLIARGVALKRITEGKGADGGRLVITAKDRARAFDEYRKVQKTIRDIATLDLNA